MSDLAGALYNYGLSAHLYLGEHSGGEATCTHGKLCDVCGTEYDTALDSDNHVSDNYSYADNEDGTHKKICECGATVNAAESHTFDENGKCVCGVQAVAKVGYTIYTNFEEALTAWTDGTTLTLLDDVTLTSYVEVTADNVSLDLNGKSLSSSYFEGVIYDIVNLLHLRLGIRAVSDFVLYCKLIRSKTPYIQFLFVRPRFCLRLPSDSASRRTPLSSANSSYCQVCSGLSPPSYYACRAHSKKQNLSP